MTQNPQHIMQQHGKTFALAAKLLTPSSRQAAAELYAFARTVDDWVDVETSLQANKHEALGNIDALRKALQNGDSSIQHLLKQYDISPQLPLVFLAAQQADSNGKVVADEAELIQYSYGVAGVIGQMMRPILGAPSSAGAYAVSLGIAMQLTNIARDVVEDAERERIYIPATFFANTITAQTLLQPSEDEKQIIFAAITRLLNLADQYYAFAQQGFAYIPFRNRLSIAAAAAMYRAIGVRILARGQAKYWQGRVSLGLLQKVGIANVALVKILLPSKQVADESLLPSLQPFLEV